MRREFLTALAWVLLTLSASAQFTIDDCQKKAREHYPLIDRYGLIALSSEYTIGNIRKGYWPQLSLSAKATYQSKVFNLPISIPGMKVPIVDKDQYQGVVEVDQVIWDGGVIQSKKEIELAQREVNEAQLDNEMYLLRERVNNIFFGVLLIKEQLKQNSLMENELKRNLQQIEAMLKQGTSTQSDFDVMKVNLLANGQQAIELKAAEKSYLEMLSAMIGELVSEESILLKPTESDLAIGIHRPELHAFDAQFRLLETQKQLLKSKNLPKIGAFVQGGYGKPGLNMLSQKFNAYAILGLSLSWNISGYYTLCSEKAILEQSQQNVILSREQFLYNINLQLLQQNNELFKARQLLVDDDEIIRLRTSIRMSSEVKVLNGTMTVTDMLRDLTAEDQARQNKLLHEVQYWSTIYQIKFTGNK